ncbi:hypothetical protein Tsp_04598 [Trichinella spiralis]|uniref:hypothetical protein n=1 Tax=Trichinella spiralis TaxID=6334 RepID=UPI0001EFD3AE|nr:hypothetical protein Tsp_04598 [Trichinella spiralis]
MHVQETVDFDGLKSTLFEASRVRPGSESFSGRSSNALKESWLFPKAFPGLSGATDKNLLQQFKGGLSKNAVKSAVLRNGTDSFAEVIEVAAQEERVGRELTVLKREKIWRKSQLGRQRTLPQSDAVSESRVVAYASRMLTKTERQTQRDMLRLSLGKDSLWRTVEKQMSILVSVSNPEMNPFAEREAFWLPCAERSSALARNSPKRSHGKVYSK